MNSAQFAGYLGRNADLRQGDQPAKSVCNFSIAVKTGWGDRESTLWVSCALWGPRAEKLATYLTKGSAVTVSGDVDLRQYDKKDGTRGAEITLNVQRVTLQGGGQPREAADPPQMVAQKSQAKAPVDDDFNDDVPFN